MYAFLYYFHAKTTTSDSVCIINISAVDWAPWRGGQHDVHRGRLWVEMKRVGPCTPHDLRHVYQLKVNFSIELAPSFKFY